MERMKMEQIKSSAALKWKLACIIKSDEIVLYENSQWLIGICIKFIDLPTPIPSLAFPSFCLASILSLENAIVLCFRAKKVL